MGDGTTEWSGDKTLYNEVKQLCPEVILDRGDMIIPLKDGRKARVCIGDCIIKTEIGLYVRQKGRTDRWEVKMAGQYGATGIPKGGSTVKSSGGKDGTKKEKKKSSKKASGAKRKIKSSSRKKS